MKASVVVLDKPAGMTSFAAVNAVKRLCGASKAGHCGTLDPDATGVLPVMLDNGVKASECLTDHDKSYIAAVCLGVTTDTGDIGGNVLSRFGGTLPDFAAFSAVASQFAGEQQQTPPMFSALKVNGQKLVDLARRGVTVERESRRIFISSIEAFEENGRFMLSVDCSRGTYIRTLCEDIGARLGCGAAMASLRRTRVGDFSLEDAVTFEQLADPEIRREKIFDIEYVFRKLQVLRLPSFFERLVRNGQAVLLRKLGFAAEIGARLRLAGETGFFALGCVCETSDGPAVKAVKQFC